MQHNIRSVTCDSCSETALEFDNDTTTAEALEGKQHVCDSCAVIGRVSYDDENGSVKLLPLTEMELVCNVDFSMMLDAYQKSQERITSLCDEVNLLKQMCANHRDGK